MTTTPTTSGWTQTASRWEYRVRGELAYTVSESCVYRGPSTFWAGRSGLGSSFATLVDAKLAVEDWAAGRGACPRWAPEALFPGEEYC